MLRIHISFKRYFSGNSGNWELLEGVEVSKMLSKDPLQLT